ncbi:MAG TPA: Lrp/AsnC family transcriptional regulator [Azospirillum sp.]|nr:Lrp/AsnC family transcriptional regulator [Azospirillum sp.]
MLTDRQIDARIRQLVARDMPPEQICVRLRLSWQRVARVLPPAPPVPAALEPPPPATTEAPPPVAAVPAVADPAARRVLELLEKAADAGAPCPAYSTTADLLGLSETRVSVSVRTLERDGVIRIARKGPQRRVTIVATGRATNWSPHPRARGGGCAIAPPGFNQSVLDQARRILMSRDYQVLSAGPGLFKVDGRIRNADELVGMANRQLATLGRPPLVGAAA